MLILTISADSIVADPSPLNVAFPKIDFTLAVFKILAFRHANCRVRLFGISFRLAI